MSQTKPLTFIPRERNQIMVGCYVDPDFHDTVKDFCSDNQIKLSQFIRFALARAMSTM